MLIKPIKLNFKKYDRPEGLKSGTPEYYKWYRETKNKSLLSDKKEDVKKEENKSSLIKPILKEQDNKKNDKVFNILKKGFIEKGNIYNEQTDKSTYKKNIYDNEKEILEDIQKNIPDMLKNIEKYKNEMGKRYILEENNKGMECFNENDKKEDYILCQRGISLSKKNEESLTHLKNIMKNVSKPNDFVGDGIKGRGMYISSSIDKEYRTQMNATTQNYSNYENEEYESGLFFLGLKKDSNIINQSSFDALQDILLKKDKDIFFKKEKDKEDELWNKLFYSSTKDITSLYLQTKGIDGVKMGGSQGYSRDIWINIFNKNKLKLIKKFYKNKEEWEEFNKNMGINYMIKNTENFEKKGDEYCKIQWGLALKKKIVSKELYDRFSNVIGENVLPYYIDAEEYNKIQKEALKIYNENLFKK